MPNILAHPITPAAIRSRFIRRLPASHRLIPSPSYTPMEHLAFWSSYPHPKGYHYFQCNVDGISFVTQIDMNSPSDQRVVDCFISAMKSNVSQEASSDGIEVFLDIKGSGAKICVYYMVDHRTRRIFWLTGTILDDLTAQPPTISGLLNDPDNEAQYWAHVVLFPSHTLQGFDHMCKRREGGPFNSTLDHSTPNEIYEVPSSGFQVTLVSSRDDRLPRPGLARYRFAVIRENTALARIRDSPSDGPLDIHGLESTPETHTYMCHPIRVCISGSSIVDPEQPPSPSFIPSARHVGTKATVKKQWGYSIISVSITPSYHVFIDP
ncbi:hypothetical protein NLI96_g5375 [Meripilus lineatus]|uniref:Uncharacterized protein n=1 Tax=Meripilus lineatus TaxID=2056292 RepID=A0AAD5V577_9APHY|nr:hypothetical protein NLI96_g5375 [Physisporinus lineatus]